MRHSPDTFMPEDQREQFSLKNLIRIQYGLKDLITWQGEPENIIACRQFIQDIDLAKQEADWLERCYNYV